MAEHFPLDLGTVVSVHLQHIEERINKEILQLNDAIFTSVSLRILFESGLIGNVANSKGMDLEILTPDLSTIPYQQAILFVCGGYEFSGQRVSPFYLYREPGLKSLHRKQFERQRDLSPKDIPLVSRKLPKFENSVSMSILGHEIKRGDLVKFVANKGGGANTISDERAVEKLEEVNKNLIRVSQSLNINDVNIVCYEIFATAWYLINSPSVNKLRGILMMKDENVITFPRK